MRNAAPDSHCLAHALAPGRLYTHPISLPYPPHRLAYSWGYGLEYVNRNDSHPDVNHHQLN